MEAYARAEKALREREKALREEITVSESKTECIWERPTRLPELEYADAVYK